MTKTGKVVVCAAGLKGFAFVEGLLQKGAELDSIVTYAQADDQARSFDRLRELAAHRSINLLETRHPTPRAEDLTFLVGWQHLLTKSANNCGVPRFATTKIPRICADGHRPH